MNNEDKVMAAANEIADQFSMGFCNDQMVEHFENIIRKHFDTEELLTQPKPVAWMYDWEDKLEKVSMQNRMTRIKAISERPEAFNVRPLYTAPPNNEPLSDEDLKQICEIEKFVYLISKQLFNIVARRIEKAHGITGESDE